MADPACDELSRMLLGCKLVPPPIALSDGFQLFSQQVSAVSLDSPNRKSVVRSEIERTGIFAARDDLALLQRIRFFGALLCVLHFGAALSFGALPLELSRSPMVIDARSLSLAVVTACAFLPVAIRSEVLQTIILGISVVSVSSIAHSATLLDATCRSLFLVNVMNLLVRPHALVAVLNACALFAAWAFVACEHVAAAPDSAAVAASLVPRAVLVLAALLQSLQGLYVTHRYDRADSTMQRDLATVARLTRAVLHARIPPHVVPRLVSGASWAGAADSAEPDVTVVFVRICRFSEATVRCSPRELLSLLERTWRICASSADRHGVRMLEVTDHVFLGVAGLSCDDRGAGARGGDHVLSAVNFGLEVIARERQGRATHHGVRVGIDTGAAVSGFLGSLRPQFVLVGDVVNTANRMTAKARYGSLLMTARAHARVASRIPCRGTRIDVKGKGEMDVFEPEVCLASAPFPLTSKGRPEVGLASAADGAAAAAINRARRGAGGGDGDGPQRQQHHPPSGAGGDSAGSALWTADAPPSGGDAAGGCAQWTPRVTTAEDDVSAPAVAADLTLPWLQFKDAVLEARWQAQLPPGRAICSWESAAGLLLSIAMSASGSVFSAAWLHLIRLIPLLIAVAHAFTRIHLLVLFGCFWVVSIPIADRITFGDASIAVLCMLTVMPALGGPIDTWLRIQLITALTALVTWLWHSGGFFPGPTFGPGESALLPLLFIWVSWCLSASGLVQLELSRRANFAAADALRASQAAATAVLDRLMPRPLSALLASGRAVQELTAVHADVALLVLDVVGFTALSAELQDAPAVFALLNAAFAAFERIVEREGAYKVKTVGDCMVVVAGLHGPLGSGPLDDDADGLGVSGSRAARAKHAVSLLRAAVDIQAAAASLLRHPRTGQPLKIRMGLHVGSVVGGVVSTRGHIYDVWGGDVATAYRAEAACPPGEILATLAASAALLDAAPPGLSLSPASEGAAAAVAGASSPAQQRAYIAGLSPCSADALVRGEEPGPNACKRAPFARDVVAPLWRAVAAMDAAAQRCPADNNALTTVCSLQAPMANVDATEVVVRMTRVSATEGCRDGAGAMSLPRS